LKILVVHPVVAELGQTAMSARPALSFGELQLESALTSNGNDHRGRMSPSNAQDVPSHLGPDSHAATSRHHSQQHHTPATQRSTAAIEPQQSRNSLQRTVSWEPQLDDIERLLDGVEHAKRLQAAASEDLQGYDLASGPALNAMVDAVARLVALLGAIRSADMTRLNVGERARLELVEGVEEVGARGEAMAERLEQVAAAIDTVAGEVKQQDRDVQLITTAVEELDSRLIDLENHNLGLGDQRKPFADVIHKVADDLAKLQQETETGLNRIHTSCRQNTAWCNDRLKLLEQRLGAAGTVDLDVSRISPTKGSPTVSDDEGGGETTPMESTSALLHRLVAATHTPDIHLTSRDVRQQGQRRERWAASPSERHAVPSRTDTSDSALI